MKASVTSISFGILCFLGNLESASAWGFSFTNLMFAIGLCHVPNGNKCIPHCHGPLAPKEYCDHQCSTDDSDSDGRRLDGFMWSEAACASIKSSSAYSDCMSAAQADCVEITTDSDASYVDYSNYDGDAASSNGTPPITSRISFLPYLIAATVAILFIIIYAYKKRQNSQQQLLDADLMKDEDEGFHGSVARRFERATTGQLPTPADVNEVGGTEYAMA